MPMRRDRDTTTWIAAWESYAEEVIREATERGEFDGLPGAGRPVDLGADNPFEGDLGPAYRLARQAGFAPAWIELGREVDRGLAALDALLAEIPPLGAGKPVAAVAPGPGRPTWRAFLRRLWQGIGQEGIAGATSAASAAALRQVMRARFLARAAEVDARVQAFNAAVPRTLSWLERPRITAATAVARFDAAFPPRPGPSAAPVPARDVAR